MQRGLVPSRERAQALVIAGKVLVGGQKLTKSGAAVEEGIEIRLLGDDLRYVGRGGLKLEKALQHWEIDIRGRNCLDIGASTGGFTDCLLQHGAAQVTAVDTGRGQIDFRLRQDSRVSLLEETNARYLTPEQIAGPFDFVAIDVSFISATLVLPAAVSAAFTGPKNADQKRELVVLVKPQFEAGREHIGKGGIVRDPEVQMNAVEKVRRAILSLGCAQTDSVESPVLGAEGNREFLLYGEF